MAQKITVQFIIEILGRPKEYVIQALKHISEKLSTERGLQIIEETIHEPKPAKNSKDLFTSFMDVTFEIEELHTLIGLIFVYTPAHIDIISPEKISITNGDISSILNSITRKIHDYDAVTRKMIMERDMAVCLVDTVDK